MPLQHKGKIALITGANKGIGFEVARQLGAEGITVLIGARNPHLGEIAEARLKADGADAHFIELDVTRPEIIARAAEGIRAEFGRLDILVNNAGVHAKGDGPPGRGRPRRRAPRPRGQFLWRAGGYSSDVAAGTEGRIGAHCDGFERTRFDYLERRSELVLRRPSSGWVTTVPRRFLT